jgi:DNA polymerase-3 subunit gamma/tau
MSHVALARKWRPQRFEDVIGQRGTIDTLKNAIASGRLAQSFIFAGPRGVGKTTTARILARALNCVKGPTPEPCGTCDACIEIAQGRDVDVLEIDGATYTGVDAVREVIVEPLAIAPMRDRFKVFIIDEVHRLSKHAFDALLKSIEEPPPYVKFMMATTDLHSVPATIQSRSQVFELKSLPFSAIRSQLKDVTARENVKIDDAALALVARSAEGSMRDALSALDQVLAFTSDKVAVSDVSTVLGLIGRDDQFDIADIVAREDAAAAFAAADRVVESGLDLRIVCREMARLTRDLLVVKIDPDRLNDPEIASESERDRLKALADQYSREDLMRAFDLLSRAEFEIKQSSQPRHQFEMALVEWIHLRKLTPLTELLAGSGGAAAVSVTSARPSVPSPPSVSSRPSVSSLPSPSASPKDSPAAAPAPPQSSDARAGILAAIREGNKMLYSMVFAQAQKVDLAPDALVVTFAPQHKSLKTQLEGKRAWVEQLAKSVTGRSIKLVTKDGEAATAPSAVARAGTGAANGDAKASALRARAKAEPAVQSVLDVFGGEIDSVEEIEE